MPIEYGTIKIAKMIFLQLDQFRHVLNMKQINAVNARIGMKLRSRFYLDRPKLSNETVLQAIFHVYVLFAHIHEIWIHPKNSVYKNIQPTKHFTFSLFWPHGNSVAIKTETIMVKKEMRRCGVAWHGRTVMRGCYFTSNKYAIYIVCIVKGHF